MSVEPRKKGWVTQPVFPDGSMVALAVENLTAALGRGPRPGDPPNVINPQALTRAARLSRSGKIHTP